MEFKLRPYQQEAIRNTLADWRAGLTDTLVVAATGLGKTVVFCALVDGMLRPRPDKRALILSHREELVYQPLDKLHQFFPHWQGDTGVVMADRNEVGARVISATVQTLSSPRRMAELLAAGPINLLITDESHHAVAATYQAIYDTLRAANPQMRHLGVTATPLRADRAGLIQVFQKVSATFDIRYGVREGYLVPPKWLAIKTGISLKGIRSLGGDFSSKQLAQVFETDNCFDLVVASHQKYAAGRRGLAFVSSVAGAYRLAEKFQAAGIVAAAADGTTDKTTRRGLLERFRAGEIEVLCNMGLWTEGLDVPEVSVIHQVRPTKSDGLYLQMVGRGLRPAPWVGKEECIILDYCPKEHRKIVMLGNLLLGEREQRVVEEQLEEEREDEVGAGFLFDQDGFKGLEGDPQELLAEQLHYLDSSPFAWERQAGVMFVGLGPDETQTDRTLWLPPAAGQLLLVERTKGTPGTYSLLAEGEQADLLEIATEYADQHANPVLAMKDARWQQQMITEGQQKYLRRLAAGEMKTREIANLRRGEAARLITYYAARETLYRCGYYHNAA